ncbi:MAG: hypothetical protein QXV17_14040 [Candidatus Micrarchaeaceae archaeon]
MSIVGSIISAIANGVVNGISSLVHLIVKGILSAIQTVLTGIQNIIGIPMNLWSVNVSNQGITIPIIFTAVLGIAIFIVLIFIDAEGLETEVAQDFTALEDL